MKRIGMLVAVEIEAVLKKYGQEIETKTVYGFEVHTYKLDEYELYIIHSGAGQIAAAAATQLLISYYEVDFIVNFGVVGGLTEEMSVTKTCIVEQVVHYDFDISEIDPVQVGQYLRFDSPFIPTTKEIVQRALELRPDLKPVICASGDKFIGSNERRMALHEQFGADICEMEAAAIVMTCIRNDIPHLLIKTVSDAIGGEWDQFYKEYLKSADICLEITEQIIRDFIQ